MMGKNLDLILKQIKVKPLNYYAFSKIKAEEKFKIFTQKL